MLARLATWSGYSSEGTFGLYANSYNLKGSLWAKRVPRVGVTLSNTVQAHTLKYAETHTCQAFIHMHAYAQYICVYL